MRYKKLIPILLIIIAASCKDKTQSPKNTLKKGNIHVAVLLYPGVELLDFSGPAEVFSNARGFDVYTVSVTDREIETNNGTLKITADYTLTDAPQPDILVVPGGPMEVINPVTANQAAMNWLRKTNDKNRLTMSVCTGAEILGKAGILDGKSATTHQVAVDTLQSLYKETHFIKDVRFVEDGKLITTAGVSAGIDGALHTVEKIKGMKEALYVTLVMQYDKWKPDDGLVIGAEQVKAMHHQHNLAPAENVVQNEPLPRDEKDPVCGMTVQKGDKITYRYKGRLYGFCSDGCRGMFAKQPETFIGK